MSDVLPVSDFSFLTIVPTEILVYLFRFIENYRSTWASVPCVCRHFRDAAYEVFNFCDLVNAYLYATYKPHWNLSKLLIHPSFRKASICEYYANLSWIVNRDYVLPIVLHFLSDGTEGKNSLLLNAQHDLDIMAQSKPMLWTQSKILKDYNYGRLHSQLECAIILFLMCQYGLGVYFPLELLQFEYSELELTYMATLAFYSFSRDTCFPILFDTNLRDIDQQIFYKLCERLTEITEDAIDSLDSPIGDCTIERVSACREALELLLRDIHVKKLHKLEEEVARLHQKVRDYDIIKMSALKRARLD